MKQRIARRVAKRYVRARGAPAILWYSWLKVKEKTLEGPLARLAPLTQFHPKIKKAYLRLKALSDNVNALIKDYEPRLLNFRKQETWTPELDALVSELASDRKLMKRLDMEVSPYLEDAVFEGLETYLEPYSAQAERSRLIDFFMRGTPQDALAYARSLDFRRHEAAFNKLLAVAPGFKVFVDPSPQEYRKWVAYLELSVDDEEAFYKNWEDRLPGWEPDALDQFIDLSYLDSSNSKFPLSWYERDLQDFKALLLKFR